MQSERDMLVTKVFPRLRQIAYERNVTLTEVDLRWGITEEEAKSSKVVEICLDEIRNSHPFFIGLLGERYGWCPSKETLIEHQAMPDRYEWLAADLDRGMSITEIEIQYGVLRSLEPVYASFYIREADEKTMETDPRQAQLKETVRNNKRYNTYDYCSPNNWANRWNRNSGHYSTTFSPKIKSRILPYTKDRNYKPFWMTNRIIIYPIKLISPIWTSF